MYYLQQELYDRMQRNNALFDFIQEAALDGLWYWDLEKPHEEWMNDRFWEVLGYEAEKQQNSPEAWQSIIFPEDAEAAFQLVQAHLKDPSVKYDQILRYQHKEGHTVWIRCRGLAIRDEDGKPIRMLGAHVDVSKAKEAERRASQLSRRFESILDNQDIFVVRIVAKGEITYTNAHFDKLFGSKSNFLSQFNEENRLLLKEKIAECLDEPNEPKRIELFCQAASGQQLYIKWQLVALADILEEGLEIQCLGIDYTEVQRTQEELRYTRNLLTRASRGARIGAWEINLEDGSTIWSEVTKEIHEVPADYVSTVEDGVAFYKEGYHRERISELAEQLIETGEPFEEDLIIVTAKGREVWVRVIGQAIMKEGKCERVYGTFQDIDTQKRDAIAKERWRQAIEQNQDEIYGFDVLNLELVYANIKAEAKHKGSVLEKQSLLNFTGNYPEAEIQGMLRALLQGDQRKASFETELGDGQGGFYPAEIQLQWVQDNQMNLYLLTARDISARKKAEAERQLLQSVVKNAQEGMLIAECPPASTLAKGLEVVYVNPAFEKITGFSLAVLQKEQLSLLRGPQTSSTVLKRLHCHLLQQEAFTLSLILYKETGIPFWAEVSAKPIFSKAGELSHWIGIMRDISKQKEHERLLTQMRNSAEIASQAKSDFLANMSHEIRTPLNGVIGFTDLLKSTDLDEIQAQYLHTVEQSAHNLLEVINDILDFSKIEAGKLELEPQKVKLSDVLQETIDIVKFQAHHRRLELLVDIDAKVPAYVWIDALRLKQVLLNLLSNAIKFTKTGEVELQVQLKEWSSPAQASLYFAVRDTGIGISKDKQERIFEAFSQADASISRRHGGTGLGLSISQRLLKLMDAELNLESSLNKGSTFYFELKLPATQEEKAPSKAKLKLNKFTSAVLLEPNTRGRHILSEMLRELGLEVRAFGKAEAALAFLQEQSQPHLVLANYALPQRNGLAFASAVEQLAPSHTLVLMHDSVEEGRLQENGGKVNHQRHLLKPLLRKQLYRRLSKLETKETAPTKQPKPSQSLSSEVFRILLAEDNKINALLVEKMLDKLLPNAELKLVNNGKKAVKAVEKWKPDLIFMDIHMPVMDGLEATQKLRKEFGDAPPIIALTAETLGDIEEESQRVGMNGYLSKPFDRDKFGAVLREYLISSTKAMES